jgi:hypothetical protein
MSRVLVGLRTCLALLISSRSNGITFSSRGTSCRNSLVAAVTATAAAFEVTAAVPGVGRFAAGMVVGGKAILAFRHKRSQRPFTLVRAARRALPRTLVRDEIGSWMASRRGRNRFVSKLGRSLIASKNICKIICSSTRKFTTDQYGLETWSRIGAKHTAVIFIHLRSLANDRTLRLWHCPNKHAKVGALIKQCWHVLFHELLSTGIQSL